MINKGTVIRLSGGEYEILSRIGEGAYGIVWEAHRRSDGCRVAVKTVQDRDPEQRIPYSTPVRRRIADTLRREIVFHASIDPEDARRRHIVPLLDHGEHEGAPVMVLTRCENSLNHVYARRRDGETAFPFDGPTLLAWIEQLAGALRFLHRMNPENRSVPAGPASSGHADITVLDEEEGRYAVRDLNFRNVLIHEGALFLSDFGTIKEIRRTLTRSVAGTPDWAAPEMLIPLRVENNIPHYAVTPRVDIYALGLMAHALIVGEETAAQSFPYKFPFLNRPFGSVGGLTAGEKQRLMEHIRRLFVPGGTTILPMAAAGLPDMDLFIAEFARLVEEMLAPRAEDRPRAADVLNRAGYLKSCFSPDLEGLKLEIPSPIAIDDRATAYIAAKGRGLPRHGRWLHLTVDGRPVPAEFRFAPAKVPAWEFDLPEFAEEGSHTVTVTTHVHGRPVRAEAAVTATADADRLWELGRWADALKKEPGHPERLAVLDRKLAGDPGFLAEYVSILEAVRSAHPEDVDINSRYWPARKRLEEAEGRQSVTEKPVKSGEEQKRNARRKAKSEKAKQRAALKIAAVLALVVIGVVVAWNRMAPDPTPEPGKTPAVSEPAGPVTKPPASGERPVEGGEKPAAQADPQPSPAEEPAPEPSPAEIARRDAQRAARAAMTEIDARLSEGDWRQAQTLLRNHRTALETHLPEQAGRVARLAQGLDFMDEAMKTLNRSSVTEQDLESATAALKQAGQAGMGQAVAQKIDEALGRADRRKAELVRSTAVRQAEAVYDEIVSLANEGKWTEAATVLARNRRQVNDRLDAERRGHIDELARFFGHMADAAAALDTRPETARSLEAAIGHYAKGLPVARRLPDEITLYRNVQDRMDDVRRRLDDLREQEMKSRAETRYSEWVAALKAGDLETAQGIVERDGAMMKARIDGAGVAELDAFMRFAASMVKGDAEMGKENPALENAVAAVNHYRNAEKAAREIARLANLESRVAGPLASAVARKDALEAEEKRRAEEAARQNQQGRLKEIDRDGNGRFIAYDDGTVLDTQTNLLWAAEDNGRDVTWDKAKEHCESFKGGGWGMPTQKQLMTLVGKENGAVKGFDCCSGCSNCIATRLIKLTCYWVWAAEKRSGSSAANVYFNNGEPYWLHPSPDLNGRALPVRSGN